MPMMACSSSATRRCEVRAGYVHVVATSPKLGANDPRYPASTLDATIASLESDGKARAAAVRAPWDWPGVDEFEVVPRVRKIGDE